MVCRIHTVAMLLLYAPRLSEASLGFGWSSLRGVERSAIKVASADRGANRDRDRPNCDGRVKCSKFVSHRPDFFVNPNATELGCSFGHVADDGCCDIPCTGVGQEVCRCVSQSEAHGDIESISGLSFAFGLIFTLVGCCACCCVGAELRGLEAAAPDDQAQDLELRERTIRSPSVSGEGLLQRGPREFIKKGRVICALSLGLFFAVWFFFSGFLVAFGVWVLFVQKNAYYNGCF